jgi:hypothetical protein
MLVLPTLAIPTELEQFIKPGITGTRKMVNGYRNKLTKSLQWVLCKDQYFCAQIFCFEVIDEG